MEKGEIKPTQEGGAKIKPWIVFTVLIVCAELAYLSINQSMATRSSSDPRPATNFEM